MMRVLQVILLLALAWVVWRLVRRALAPPPNRTEPPEFEPTARCAQCGTHVPRTQLDAHGVCRHCRNDRG
jgi:hypothetical protein